MLTIIISSIGNAANIGIHITIVVLHSKLATIATYLHA